MNRMYVAAIAAIFGLTVPVFADILETHPGGTAKLALGASVTKSCKIVVPTSCAPAKTELGTLAFSSSDETMTKVASTTTAHCIDKATGTFEGGGAYKTATITFTATGGYGYEQVTARCAYSDGSKKKHVLRIRVTEK